MDSGTPEDEDFPGRLLHQAALWDNAELLCDLLGGDQAAHVDSRDSWGRTPLHAAATTQRSRCLPVLLKAGADPNIPCGPRGENRTALHVSAEHGDRDNVAELLAHGADLLARDAGGLTALDVADKADHADCMKLLRDTADERVRERNDRHATLREHCLSGDVGKAKAVLDVLGTDAELVVNMAPGGSNTILFSSCEVGVKDVVKLLLARGADGRIHPVTRYSPLYIACYNGRTDIAELLLQKFPELVEQSTVEQWLPLHACCINGHASTLQLLLSFTYPDHLLHTYSCPRDEWTYEMAFDINAGDATGQSALYVACLLGSLPPAETLLKFRVRATRRREGSEERVSPSRSRRISGGIGAIMARLSLSALGDGATAGDSCECQLSPLRLNTLCNGGSETALHAAVRGRHGDVAAMLLSGGADPNVGCRTADNETPAGALLPAIKHRDIGLVDLLLKHGARDDECRALKVAATNRDDLLIARLLSVKAYADPDYKLNKAAMPEEGVFSQLALNAGLTYSSLFPSTPTMINWHNQRCQLAQIRQQWLVEAALTVNPRLRLNPRHPTVALHAITRIDLSQNSLVWLPLTLFQLQSLRSLNVAQNKIEKLPDPEPVPAAVGGRKKSTPAKGGYGAPVLEELYLQDNRLEWINADVFSLPSLTTLDVSNNKLQALPCEMWRAQQLKELNASFNLLRDLPWEPTPTLGELASPMSPTEPMLAPRFGDVDISEDQLTDARTLQLSQSVQQLDVVRHNLWSRQVEVTEQVLRSDDDATADRCSQLSALNLAHNQFAAVPSCLACLAVRLTRLNLSYNCLGSMSHITSYPGGLKQLDLSHNNISVWPSLPGLDALDSSVACFAPKDSAASQCLPPAPGGRRSLRCAVLRRVCAHRRQLRLDALRTLVLADNQLHRIQLATDDDGSVSEDDDSSDWDLVGGAGKSRLMFPNLSMLDVSNNRLSEVPPAIHELSNLSVLNISGNHDVNELPPQMGLLSRLWNLNTRGCSLQEPLKSMIDSKKFKTMDVVGYLRSVLEDARPYARMKLMLVGVAGIGKTSLLDQLRSEGSFKRRAPEHWAKRMGNKNINTKTSRGVNMSTVGVDIADWCYEKKVRGSSSHGPVVFRTWDFGGQREYYATHQYFLSKRSLYLVVWKIPDGAKAISEILHWLVSIQARAPNSPVLIIGTHYDLMRETLPSSRSEDLQQVIREKFINIVDAEKCGLPRVLDTIEVSCKTRHNIKLLCNLIYDTVFSLKPPGSKELLLEQRVPSIYLSLEDAVCHLSTERRNAGGDPVLSAEQFRLAVAAEMQRRNQRAFRDAAELRQAALFLHDNGVLLHYEDATLKDLYFLDPQWLCDMLAHVVTIREINPFASSGVMRLEDLPLVFKSSSLGPSDTRGYVVSLLNKFEVALSWDARTLLIPSLLPAEDGGHQQPTRVKIPMRSRGWSLRSKKPSSNSTPASTLVGNSQFYAPSSSPIAEQKPALIAESDRAIRRLLLMSYFPAGFWPRLITRLLADDAIVDIVRSFFVTPKDMVFDAGLVQQLDVPPEWMLWQTGMELRCGDVTLFRMKELLPSVRSAPVDYRALRYRLKQEGAWTDTSLTGSSALEMLVPRRPLTLTRSLGQEEGVQHVVLEPSAEGAARLLALAVDHVDLLLEDWYPTLGTRFVHTSEGRFLVTRLAPCPRCLLQLAAEEQSVPFADEIEEALARREAARRSLGSSDRDSGVDPDSARSSRVSSLEGHPEVGAAAPSLPPPCFAWLVEECILAACDSDVVACPEHGDISLAAIAPDTLFLDLGERHLIRPELVTRGALLGRGAFGFVFRGTCELRGSRQVVPVALKMLQPVPPGPGARQSALIAFKGAQGKWARDPVQHACKAHCTARQELGVLLSLRHAHIVPLVGVVTRPLALVLALAPRGALDSALRDFRRSGARLDPPTLQALILQAAKAMEYLHQQRVIYRDLKSENVLVWQLPAPFQAGPAGTHIKLADYGISRQALPSGAKGFGGTEGFMAPEIMRFNGEEEYTEKVDCFSFGMFVYELLTLHQPFEGHEAVKECILEGGRPSLTYRETLHPSYMLDLMVLCWAQSPRDRPSASQIVSIASAPEFTHLVDAVSLGHADVFAAAACSDGADTWTAWIACSVPRCHLLSVSATGVVGHSSLPVTRRVTAVQAVERDVWLGDCTGSLHCYRGATGEKRWSYALESDSAVVALAVLPASRVAAALANGRLFLLAADGPSGATTALGSFVLTELGSATALHALATLESDKSCLLWCGESNGGVSVFWMRDAVVTSHRPLCHPEPLGQVLLLVATAATQDSPAAVYSYVYPGCVVYQWDPDSLEVRSRLDVSKLVPCSESLKSISIEEHLSPGKCQVASLASLDGQLYIGTAWGCVVVAQCAGLRPVTVFRPLGGAVGALLPLPPRKALFAGRGHRSLVARYVSSQAQDSDDVFATVWQTLDWAPV